MSLECTAAACEEGRTGALRGNKKIRGGGQSVAAGPGAVMSFAGLSGGHRRFVF